MVKVLRVLACAYTCSPTGEGERFGGGEDVLGWNLVRQLARFHQVVVLAHTRNRPSVEGFLQSEPITNLQFHYLELPGLLRPLQQMQGGIQLYAFLWQIWAYFAARRLHREHQFDAFHHLTYANDWMASYIGALLPVTYVRGPGGGAHRTPSRFLNQYGFKGRLWEMIRSTGQWVFQHDPFFIAGQSRAQAIILCNHEALAALPQKWRQKAYLLSVCGVSTVDLAMYSMRRYSNGPFRVLSAGKLLRIKGFRLAIQAFSIFATKYPDSQFTIVGDGPEFPHLENLVRKLGIQKSIKFERWMPREQLLEEMASNDVFLFPGLRDGGGTVVVEAMAMGKPVVSLDISGPAMHVTERTGMKISAISPEYSVKEMAHALERLYLDQTLREDMGKAARERAELVYHWDKTGESLHEIYRNMTYPDPGI